MRLWGGKPAAPAPLEPVPAEVPPETWALRAVDAPVPVGFFGVLVNEKGDVVSEAVAGQKLKIPTGSGQKAAWWVRSGPWEMRFAPHPRQAPEAGLAVVLEPQETHGSHSFIGSLLLSFPSAITADDLAPYWRGAPCIRAMPPCVTPLQLEERRLELRRYATARLGLVVSQLRRVDLDLPAPSAPAQPPRQQPASQPPQESRAAPVQPDWADVVAQDELACQRLWRDLPRLDTHLRHVWAGPGWSADLAIYRRQQAVAQRVGLLGAKLGRPVALAQPFYGGRAPTRLQRLWIAAASSKAEQVLNEAWAVVAQLQPKTEPNPEQLLRLEDVVDRLEHEINRRLKAWWELDLDGRHS